MIPAFSLRRRAQFIGDTPCFRRIRDIPRRLWTDRDLEELATGLTALLKTRAGTMRLKPAQALALHDIAEHGCLFGPLRVGSGKTLITLLAPYVLQAKNPLLMLPAGLIGKTQREMKEDYSPHWKIPRNIEFLSYEMCARAENADKLLKKKPDVIILDECHRAKNPRAGVTKRLARLMRERPETKVIAVSGSIMTHSLRDFAHLTRWALKDRAPVPTHEGELDEWADALDEGVGDMQRLDPGALLLLASDEDQDEDPTVTARRGFRRRMTETAGVVCTSGESVASSLYVRELPLTCSKATEEHYKRLREAWERPDGWAFEEAMQVWKTARELSLGFCYVWEPLPPEDWLQARREWAKFVRETLSASRTLDTPGQVKNCVEEGTLDDGGLLAAWLEIEPTFTPNLKAIWHDDIALKACEKWAKENEGIVWCEHTFFARELARRTGLAYYGREGLNSNGEYIEKASGTIIASIAANSTGRNLQKWSKALWTSCPTTSTGCEQLAGRLHRDGQQADTVEIDVMLGCWEHWTALTGAWDQAKAERDTMPGSDQAKLLIADISWPSWVDIKSRHGYRWMATADVSRLKKTINLTELL